ncbi:MAG: rRNA pseudouridine synthase [Lachnospiraceae bacterium]|nr:rRNA pseudouridine synthase [Lachnospiraceae bacterium]
MQIRLDKYLADMGIGTRSQVKQYIKKKQVQVNGAYPKGAEQKVDTEQDLVTYQGRQMVYAAYEYYMFYKPKGCVSAATDSRHKTVLDYFQNQRRKDLFPVGRLDLDTEGMLLITNDGEFAHNLLAPGKHVPKTYYARISGRVTEEDVVCFAKGLDIGEKKLTLPGELKILSGEEAFSEIELTIMEGKFHQVKRMFEAVGKQVVYLKRISMGGVKLDSSLKPGEYRTVTEEELRVLKGCKRK